MPIGMRREQHRGNGSEQVVEGSQLAEEVGQNAADDVVVQVPRSRDEQLRTETGGERKSEQAGERGEVEEVRLDAARQGLAVEVAEGQDGESGGRSLKATGFTAAANRAAVGRLGK